MRSLVELCALEHKQSLGLKEQIAKIETIVFDLENLGRNCNKLTETPEDRKPAMHQRVCGIAVAHKQERLWQQVPDQKRELANSKASFARRSCVVECNSILNDIETTLANMNGQVPVSSRAGILCRRSGPKITGSNTRTCSGEVFEPSTAAHQLDAVSLVCSHHSAFGKESAHVSENVGHPALVEITHCQPQEDANAQVQHGHGQMQLMLARARRCLEQVVPLNECHLSHNCSAELEEPGTVARMLTN